jgi:hypothetical protein
MPIVWVWLIAAIALTASALANAQDACQGGGGENYSPPKYTVDVPVPVTLCLTGQIVPTS